MCGVVGGGKGGRERPALSRGCLGHDRARRCPGSCGWAGCRSEQLCRSPSRPGKSEGVSFAASVRGACQHVQHVFLTAHIATPTFCSPAKTCKGRSAVTSHQRNHARSPARMSTSKKSGPRALPPGCNEGPYPGSEATYPIEDLSAEQLAWLAVLSEHEQPAIGLAVSDQLVEGEISELDHPWTFRGAGLQQFGRAKQSSRPTTRERTEPHRHAHTHGHTRGVNFFNASSCSYLYARA